MIVIVLVAIKFSNRGDDSAQVLSEAKELIAQLEVYKPNAEYLDKLTERAHRHVFDKAYDMGGRRRGATFDEDKYLTALLDYMMAQCRTDRENDIAVALQKMREELAAETETTD